MSRLLTMPEKVQWTGWEYGLCNFERQSWKGRSRLAHKQEALRTLEARSPAERAKLESKYILMFTTITIL